MFAGAAGDQEVAEAADRIGAQLDPPEHADIVGRAIVGQLIGAVEHRAERIAAGLAADDRYILAHQLAFERIAALEDDRVVLVRVASAIADLYLPAACVVEPVTVGSDAAISYCT